MFHSLPTQYLQLGNNSLNIINLWEIFLLSNPNSEENKKSFTHCYISGTRGYDGRINRDNINKSMCAEDAHLRDNWTLPHSLIQNIFINDFSSMLLLPVLFCFICRGEDAGIKLEGLRTPHKSQDIFFKVQLLGACIRFSVKIWQYSDQPVVLFKLYSESNISLNCT